MAKIQLIYELDGGVLEINGGTLNGEENAGKTQFPVEGKKKMMIHGEISDEHVQQVVDLMSKVRLVEVK